MNPYQSPQPQPAPRKRLVWQRPNCRMLLSWAVLAWWLVAMLDLVRLFVTPVHEPYYPHLVCFYGVLYAIAVASDVLKLERVETKEPT